MIKDKTMTYLRYVLLAGHWAALIGILIFVRYRWYLIGDEPLALLTVGFALTWSAVNILYISSTLTDASVLKRIGRFSGSFRKAWDDSRSANDS
jgi:hypothetical protein